MEIGAEGKIGSTSASDPEDRALGPEDATMFRAVAAWLNHSSQDRPDIAFATMTLCPGIRSAGDEEIEEIPCSKTSCFVLV